LVFDCGGTLLHLEPSKEDLCARVLEGLGLDVQREAIRRAYEIAEYALPQKSSQQRGPEDRKAYYRAFNRSLCIQLGLESHADEFDRRRQATAADAAHWRALPETAGVLERLAGQRRLYVLANWEAHLSQHLRTNQIARHFAGIFDSQTLGAEKPDARIFERFLEETGVRAEHCVYIGTEYLADVVGSRRQGLLPVLLDRASRFGPEIDCPVISELAELEAMLA
jgi:putative hydrolase of the HAD superfamily